MLWKKIIIKKFCTVLFWFYSLATFILKRFCFVINSSEVMTAVVYVCNVSGIFLESQLFFQRAPILLPVVRQQ